MSSLDVTKACTSCSVVVCERKGRMRLMFRRWRWAAEHTWLIWAAMVMLESCSPGVLGSWLYWMGRRKLRRQGCTQPKLSSADGTNRRRWPPFCHRSTSGSLCPSSVVCQRCSAQFAPQYHQRSRQMDWTKNTPGCHRRRNGIQGRGLLQSCREEPSRQRIAGAPTLSPGAHQNKGRGVPSTRSGWWQTASYPPGRAGTNARQYQPPPGRERAYAVTPYGLWCRMLLIGQATPTPQRIVDPWPAGCRCARG